MKKDKKNVLYNLGENINLDDFDHSYVEHEFSDEYKAKKSQVLESVSRKEHARKAKFVPRIAIAAAAALVVTVPSSVFAAKQIMSGFNKKQTNTYEYQMTFDDADGDNTTENASTATSKAPAPPEIYVKMDVNYLPDGVVEQGQGSNKYAQDGSWDSNRNFTIVLAPLAENQVIKIKNAIATKDVMIGDKPATIFFKDALDITSYDKDMLIYFKEYNYAVEIFAQVSITEDELIKIADGIELTPCEEEVANKSFVYYESTPSNSNNTSTTQQEVKTLDTSKFLTLNSSLRMNNVDGFYSSDIEYTIQDYDVLDSISGLDESLFGNDLSDVKKLTDENGDFIGYTHKNIEYGDGVSSINKVVSEEHVDVKMIYVTMKVKNTGNSDIDEIKLAPQICCLNSDNTPGKRNACEKASPSGYHVYCDMPTMYDQNPDLYKDQIQRYIQRYSVPAGEERIIHVGYIVDADEMDNMALFYNEQGRIDAAENDHIIKLAK